MTGIISSIYYNIKSKRKSFWGFLIFMIIFYGLMVNLSMLDENDKNASDLITHIPSLLYYFSFFSTGHIVGRIVCDDMADKTVYHEIMSGFSRTRVYFTRAISATVLSALFGVFMCLYGVLLIYLKYGWGTWISPEAGIIRLLLLFFPFLRFAALSCIIGTLLKKYPFVIAFGIVYEEVFFIIKNIVGNDGIITSFSNMESLFDMSKWGIYNISPSVGIIEYNSYNSFISQDLIISTIGISLLMTVIYLVWGYGLFKREDLG